MMVGGAFVYVCESCERGRVALKILNNYCVYIMRSVITRFLPVDPDNRIIMELQCTYSFISCSLSARHLHITVTYNSCDIFSVQCIRIFMCWNVVKLTNQTIILSFQWCMPQEQVSPSFQKTASL